MTLTNYHKKYEDILNSDISSYKKDVKFGELMTELENAYRIPAMKNEEFEKENRKVIALYRKISNSRTL